MQPRRRLVRTDVDFPTTLERMGGGVWNMGLR